MEAILSQPLEFVKAPDSFLYASLREPIEANLDFWIDTLSSEGVWSPSWNWGGYEEAWQEAERDIKGGMSVERLKILRRFQRVES